MALIKCKECGAEISSKAEKCPACGAPVKTNISIETFFAGILLIIFLSGLYNYVAEKKVDKDSVTQQPIKPTEYIKINAMQLENAYRANEVAADYKYKGKQLIVDGEIKDISKDFMDSVIVSLKVENQFMSVDARDVNPVLAAQLVKDTPITLICIGNGMVMSSPQLKKCEIDTSQMPSKENQTSDVNSVLKQSKNKPFHSSANAEMDCSAFQNEGQDGKQVDNMEKLAKLAHLPQDYFNKYHEEVVYDFCVNGDIESINSMIDVGSVNSTEVKSIQKVLGITATILSENDRSENGRKKENLNAKFIEIGLCEACASVVVEYYISFPNSQCGQLAQKALSGSTEATNLLMSNLPYCQIKEKLPKGGCPPGTNIKDNYCFFD